MSRRLLAAMFGLTFSMLLLLTACQDLENGVATGPVYPSFGVMVDSPYNPNNPWDSVGVWHNEAVLYVIGEYAPVDSTYDEWNNQMQSNFHYYLTRNMGLTASQATELMDTAEFDYQNWGGGPFYEIFQNYQNANLADWELEYIHRMGNLYDICASHQEVHDSLVQIENELVNSSNVSDITWILVSVTKHSHYLWTKQEDGSFLKTSKRNVYLISPFLLDLAIADAMGCATKAARVKGTYLEGNQKIIASGGSLVSMRYLEGGWDCAFDTVIGLSEWRND